MFKSVRACFQMRPRQVCAAFLLIAFIFSAPLPAGAGAQEYRPEHITMTWTDNPATTRTITWKTAATEPDGQIQYAVASQAGKFTAAMDKIIAKSAILSAKTGDIIIHTATLTGLKPGARYVYRLGNGRQWSSPRGFTTAPANAANFKFLVFGDSQSIRYDVWRALIRQAFHANKNAAFVTVVGDLVDTGDDYDEWKDWFDAAEEVIGNIAVMPLTGNHETYTPVWGERSMPKMFAAQFKLPANGPEMLKGLTYSFDYGNTHFVILDSQEREEARFVPDMLAKQKKWLAQDLAATKKKWKVVLLHKPPYHSYAGRGNDSVREAFVPIIEQYGVDIVISGHDHVYARTYPLAGGQIVPAGQGTVYLTAGRSGTKKAYQNSQPNKLHEFFYNPVDEPNYLTVEIKNNRMTIKAFKQSGVIIDSLTIHKQSLGEEAA